MINRECKGFGCLHDFIRRGYYGGRVEVLTEKFDGPGQLSLGDFNSMYPAVMLEPMPMELKAIGPTFDFDRMAKHYLGFVECEVYIPKDTYLPPLPYRFENRLVFPVGCFSGVWSSVELQRIRKIGGGIRRVIDSAWFSSSSIFSDFIRHWYAFRDKTQKTWTESLDAVAKLMLNSLYGKFGMSEDRTKIWIGPGDEDFANHKLTPLGQLTNEVYTEKVRSSSSYVIPQISAWVTALARCKLWDAMLALKERGKRLWYCDTDSIVTDDTVSDSKKLGDLKLDSRINCAWFVAPKLYWIDVGGTDKIKAKGFGGGFDKKELTRDEFEKLVKYRSKVTLRKLIKARGMFRGKKLQMETMQKGLKGAVNNGVNVLDSKRIHLPNGETKPLVINE